MYKFYEDPALNGHTNRRADKVRYVATSRRSTVSRWENRQRCIFSWIIIIIIIIVIAVERSNRLDRGVVSLQLMEMLSFSGKHRFCNRTERKSKKFLNYFIPKHFEINQIQILKGLIAYTCLILFCLDTTSVSGQNKTYEKAKT